MKKFFFLAIIIMYFSSSCKQTEKVEQNNISSKETKADNHSPKEEPLSDCEKYLVDYEEFALDYMEFAKKFRSNPLEPSLYNDGKRLDSKMHYWTDKVHIINECDSPEFKEKNEQIEAILFEAIEIIENVSQ